MIKPHLLYISSPDKKKLVKLSLESFKKFSCTDYYSTLIVNTPEKGNLHIDGDVEIIYDNSHYKDHPPTRWSIKPRSEVCLFVDYDVIVQSDIRPLIKICEQTNSICGVIAYCCKIKSSLFKKAFEECGVTYLENRKTWIGETPIPRYYNYGVLAVPSTWLKVIHGPLSCNIKTVNKLSEETQDHYLRKHGGQIALAITLEQLNVPTIDLDIKYNFPNVFTEITRPDEIVFEHMLDKSDLSIAKFKNIVYGDSQLNFLL